MNDRWALVLKKKEERNEIEMGASQEQERERRKKERKMESWACIVWEQPVPDAM